MKMFQNIEAGRTKNEPLKSAVLPDDPAHMLVEATQPANIDTVIVDGRMLKRGGAIGKVDVADVIWGARQSIAIFTSEPHIDYGHARSKPPVPASAPYSQLKTCPTKASATLTMRRDKPPVFMISPASSPTGGQPNLAYDSGPFFALAAHERGGGEDGVPAPSV